MLCPVQRDVLEFVRRRVHRLDVTVLLERASIFLSEKIALQDMILNRPIYVGDPFIHLAVAQPLLSEFRG